MRIPTRSRTHGLHFNITPLIDVVFLLVIFFLVASHLVRSEQYEDVVLPEAEQTEKEVESQPPHRLVITITEDRQWHVNGRSLPLAEVEQSILAASLEASGDSLEVHLRGDRTVPYEVIEPLLLACARAGITHVKFPVIPP